MARADPEPRRPQKKKAVTRAKYVHMSINFYFIDFYSENLRFNMCCFYIDCIVQCWSSWWRLDMLHHRITSVPNPIRPQHWVWEHTHAWAPSTRSCLWMYWSFQGILRWWISGTFSALAKQVPDLAPNSQRRRLGGCGLLCVYIYIYMCVCFWIILQYVVVYLQMHKCVTTICVIDIDR